MLHAFLGTDHLSLSEINKQFPLLVTIPHIYWLLFKSQIEWYNKYTCKKKELVIFNWKFPVIINNKESNNNNFFKFCTIVSISLIDIGLEAKNINKKWFDQDYIWKNFWLNMLVKSNGPYTRNVSIKCRYLKCACRSKKAFHTVLI